MSLNAFIARLGHDNQLEFEETMALIEAHYTYTPARFSNGLDSDAVVNEAGSNEGSCKIFAFAQLNSLNADQTLACFGRFYRSDVLQNPDGNDHANIRNFIRHGWAGICFEQPALTAK